jgi:hypothetical protein
VFLHKDRKKEITTRKLVSIVVPMSTRVKLLTEEEISLRHLMHYLGKYDKYLVVPHGLKVDIPGFRIKSFDPKFFGSTIAHRNLVLSSLFYKSFSEYKFILIYHLDSLVFSDELIKWCERDYDFIGAPWIIHEDAPYAGNSFYEGKVGNSGFALKKVSSYLKILNSSKLSIDPDLYWKKNYSSKKKYSQLINLPKKYLMHIKKFNGVRTEIASTWKFSEERFIANRGKYYYPEFKIASLESALRFAFECVPRYCFEKNNNQLPFGCHAWSKYDRDFWEPYLLK